MTSFPFAGGEWTTPFRIGRGTDFAAYADSILFTPAVGGGTTHVVTAAVMIYAGQSVTSSAATLHAVTPATMSYAGQAVASSNATVHAVAAAVMNYAGQNVASATPTSHTADPAVMNYAGRDIAGSGVTGAADAVSSTHYGKHYGYRKF